MDNKKESKKISPFFPEAFPSIIIFLITHLLKAFEREDYLYKKLKHAGLLNEKDMEILSSIADYERIPTFTSEIRDKAIEDLNRIVKEILNEPTK